MAVQPHDLEVRVRGLLVVVARLTTTTR